MLSACFKNWQYGYRSNILISFGQQNSADNVKVCTWYASECSWHPRGIVFNLLQSGRCAMKKRFLESMLQLLISGLCLRRFRRCDFRTLKQLLRLRCAWECPIRVWRLAVERAGAVYLADIQEHSFAVLERLSALCNLCLCVWFVRVAYVLLLHVRLLCFLSHC